MALSIVLAVSLCVLPAVLSHHSQLENAITFDGPHTSSIRVEFPHDHARFARQQGTLQDAPNNTNITIQRDTHLYYNSSFHGPGTTADSLWLDLNTIPDMEVIVSTLSDEHYVYQVHSLPFDFPFYGHTINQVGVSATGFLYTGTLFHQFIHLTQFIAPLQADFNPGLNDSATILILSTPERFTVQWDMVHNHDHVEDGPFTFQTTLFPSGEIHFVYREIPLLVDEIDNDGHPVEVGLADGFYIITPFFGVNLVRLFEYSRISLNATNNLNFSAYVITPLPNCVTAASCEECIATTQISSFDCQWCSALNRCSDGFDRFRQDWEENGCLDTATTECDVPTSGSQLSSAAVGGIAVGGLVLLVIVLLVAVVFCILLYGYMHPTSKLGLFMIEHRPGAHSLNKTNKSASYNVESGKTVLEEQ